MKTKLLLFAALLMAGCETEPVDFSAVEKTPLTGTFSASGYFISPEITGKGPVPDCSDITPNQVNLIFVSNGQETQRSTSISIDGESFTMGTVELPQGTYTVEEAYLSNGGTITHAVPNVVDPRFAFSEFVNNPLPFEVTILPGETTARELETLCYTSRSIPINGELGWDGTAQPLSTAIIFTTINNCANLIGIRFGFGGEIFVPISPDDAVTVPLPRNRPFEVRAYQGQSQVNLIGPDGAEVGFYVDEITYLDEEIPEPFTAEGLPNPQYSDFLNANSIIIDTACD